MPSSFVWVQLYYEGKKEAEGDPVQVYQSDLADGREWNIASLKEAVKDKSQVALSHCDAGKLVVYPPKSSSSGDKNKYKPGKKLEEVIQELKNTTPPTSDDHPLIVVAPQQQADVDDRELQDRLRFGGWYLVSGRLERDKNAGGVRAQLVQLAKGGYYQDGQNIEAAFSAGLHPDKSKPNSRLISISIVFTDEGKADNFIAAVDSFVTLTRGLSWYSDLQKDSIVPFAYKKPIRRSHYVAREEDGEPPDDSPVYDVELGSINVNSVASTYIPAANPSSYSDSQLEVLSNLQQEAQALFPIGASYDSFATLREELRKFAHKKGFAITSVGLKLTCTRAETPQCYRKRKARKEPLPIEKQRTRTSTRVGCCFQISCSPANWKNRKVDKTVVITKSSKYAHSNGCFPCWNQLVVEKRKAGQTFC